MTRRALSMALVALSLACGAPHAALADLDPGGVYPSVVYLSSDCSGVLVAPARVLTSAHCVGGLALPRVRVEGDHARWATDAIACVAHPAADPAGATECARIDTSATIAAHDLALLTLAEAVPSEIARPTRILLATPYDGGQRWCEGARVVLVGFQHRPTLLTPPQRFAGSNDVRTVSGATLETAPLATDGFRTGAGSSGGPALVTLAGEDWIVGVLFGGTGPGSPESVFTATFDHDNADWLLSVAPELRME